MRLRRTLDSHQHLNAFTAPRTPVRGLPSGERPGKENLFYTIMPVVPAGDKSHPTGLGCQLWRRRWWERSSKRGRGMGNV